ncbi:hypothetical protein CV751_15930 [Achromobacter ruhlandii]|nr:hypothetical protein CV751_15930 [Achromobacter ruhlandii]
MRGRASVTGENTPTLRRCAGRCPPRGHFCLGAALRRKRPHAPPLRGSLPPKGAFLPWGGPATKKAR